MLTGRRQDALERVARRIENQGGSAVVEGGDVTDSERVNAIVAIIREKLNRLDIVVNNAGVNLKERHWVDLTPGRIDTILEGNLSARSTLLPRH